MYLLNDIFEFFKAFGLTSVNKEDKIHAISGSRFDNSVVDFRLKTVDCLTTNLSIGDSSGRARVSETDRVTVSKYAGMVTRKDSKTCLLSCTCKTLIVIVCK